MAAPIVRLESPLAHFTSPTTQKLKFGHAKIWQLVKGTVRWARASNRRRWKRQYLGTLRTVPAVQPSGDVTLASFSPTVDNFVSFVASNLWIGVLTQVKRY